MSKWQILHKNKGQPQHLVYNGIKQTNHLQPKGGCPMLKSIHHYETIYNLFRQLNLGSFLSDVYLEHIAFIITLVFKPGYSGKTVDFDSCSDEKMQDRINKNLSEIEKINSDIAELYSDYKGGMFTQKDFLIIKKEFKKKKTAAENAVLKIKEEIENSKQANADNSALIEEFKQFRNITEITRNIAVRLIKQIKVYEDGSLYLELDCEDHLCKYMQKAEMIKLLSMREAI